MKKNYLQILEEMIDLYLADCPTNSGSYKHKFTEIPKPLRDGVVFYSSGWGWRLRKNWENKLAELKREVE